MSAPGGPHSADRRCQFDVCEADSDYWLDVRWSVADFDFFYVCFDHLWPFREQLLEHLVDGAPPVEVTVVQLDPAWPSS